MLKVRKYDHWNSVYVANRLINLFRSYARPNYPMINHEIVSKIGEHLSGEDNVLEFGAGRSTAWFARHSKFVISHEHDPYWSSIVERKLENLGLSGKVDLKLFPATDDGTPKLYWESIDNYEDESFDLVLIDGKYRARCAVETLKKLKPSGWLVIDDVHRYLPKEPKSSTPGARSISDGYASERWGRFAELVSGWDCDWRSDGVWDTAIFWRR